MNDIEHALDNFSHYKRELRWLLKLGVKTDRIVNFGCDWGLQTCALMCFLGAREGLGIDKNKSAIDIAKKELEAFKQEIQKGKYGIHPEITSKEGQELWGSKFLFFLRLIQGKVQLEYKVQDMTGQQGIPLGYYDLAFAGSVLNHIWGNSGEQATQSAVKQMVEVVKPGGIIAATQYIQIGDTPQRDYKALFEREKAGRLIAQNERAEFNGIIGEYIYQKAI
jgi:SAM-dependent methyltransferase